MVALKISLFGGFEVRHASGEPLALAGRKLQALLARLAIAPGEARSREALMALLWSDRSEEQARGSFRQSLAELRRALADVVPMPLVADREKVMLDAEAVEVDVAMFEALFAEGTPEALARAAALYAGELLDGFAGVDPAFEEWLRDERTRLREDVTAVLTQLLDRQSSQGETDAAIATARRLLEIDRLREGAHRALMKLYADKGERTLALRQYRACCDVLDAELGVEPEAETERLASEIRSGAIPAGAADKPSSADGPLTVETLQLPDKPSIAVLPFTNLSGDADQEYFADGITEDIITEIARFRSLFVIARNSSFSFKGQAIEVKDIARRLGVRYLVEGSVRRAGNRVRITAQLIDAANDKHLWAERYDRELEDIFAVQDEVTRAIVTEIEPELVSAERERARRKPPSNMDAWEWCQRGLWHLCQFSPEENTTAQDMFHRSIALDPGFAQPYAALAYSLFYDLLMGYVSEPGDRLTRAHEAAKTAVMLDDKDSFSHYALGRVSTMLGNHDEAIDELDKAVALNPNSALAHHGRGYVLTLIGRAEEALDEYDEGLRLSPRDPLAFAMMTMRSLTLTLLRRHEEAVEWARRSQRQPGAAWVAWTHAHEASALAHLGHVDEARAARARALAVLPTFSVSFIDAVVPFRNPADRDHYIDGLRRAGLPE